MRFGHPWRVLLASLIIYTFTTQASATSLYITVFLLLCKLSISLLLCYSNLNLLSTHHYHQPTNFSRICWQSSFVVAYTSTDFTFIPYKCFLIVLLRDIQHGMEGKYFLLCFILWLGNTTSKMFHSININITIKSWTEKVFSSFYVKKWHLHVCLI